MLWPGFSSPRGFEVRYVSVYAAATSYKTRRLPVLKEKIGVVGAGKIGAAIMRGLQARLGRLHEAMAREPHRHWRILPRDLEASISA